MPILSWGKNSDHGIKGVIKGRFCTIFVEVVDLEVDIPVSLSGLPAEVDGPFLG